MKEGGGIYDAMEWGEGVQQFNSDPGFHGKSANMVSNLG